MAFWFAACQPGSERMLKAEVARSHPLLRPAYSRPGLVTWKGDAGAFPDTIFARVAGVSYGPATDASQVVARAREAGTKRLHVWKREGEPAPEAREALLATGAFLPEERPKAGETVLDVIVADGEPSWVGAHTHVRGGSPWAGGLYKIELPADAPSRAYLKLEEALAWSGVRPKAGETALEIGSSPGGASHALLRRGLKVIGVDPGEMAEPVASHGGFRHIKVAVGGLRREDVPDHVDWLLLDVNLAPQVALHQIKRIVPMVRRHLRGAFFTLKLNEEAFAAEIPAFLERIRGMALPEVRATQLPANRKEICVYASRAGS